MRAKNRKFASRTPAIPLVSYIFGRTIFRPTFRRFHRARYLSQLETSARSIVNPNASTRIALYDSSLRVDFHSKRGEIHSRLSESCFVNVSFKLDFVHTSERLSLMMVKHIEFFFQFRTDKYSLDAIQRE